jgi:Rod binding domain-containing protein
MSDTVSALATSPAQIPSGPSDTTVDPKIWQAAQNFEAMAIGQLLAPMFATVDVSHSLFGGGDAEATWRPMLVDAIGKQMQAHGGLGLAQPVYAAMLRAQEGGTPKRAAGMPVSHYPASNSGRHP